MDEHVPGADTVRPPEALVARATSYGASILAALSDPSRLVVLCWFLDVEKALAPDPIRRCAEETGLGQSVVTKAVSRLAQAGIIARSKHGAVGTLDPIKSASQLLDEANPITRAASANVRVASVFSHGRLVDVPPDGLATLVGNFIAGFIPVGVDIDERQLNEMLSAFHDDVASIRRLLVDTGELLRPAPAVYRRPVR